MRLTHQTDLSLRVLMQLALIAPQRTTIQEISESYRVSRNHLMKVAHQLALKGYVDSARGSGGGLTLGRPAGEIVVGKVVRDMEPDFGLTECFRPDNQCVITSICALPAMLDEALQAFLKTLDQYTLADLVTPKNSPQMADILKLRLN
ncbi:MAG TPA: Rrf2 family transcriptional regulator [Wenzhouxiangella sp.]|nr:Rrf2 family transcriptional regulator [Wenzhouxiangella sp.]